MYSPLRYWNIDVVLKSGSPEYNSAIIHPKLKISEASSFSLLERYIGSSICGALKINI